MIEREVFQIITSGLAYLKATPGAVSAFFQKTVTGMDAAEAAKVEAWFHESTPKVQHGYARVGATFPLYCITLGSDAEETTFIGNDGGVEDDETDVNFGAEGFAAMMSQVLNVLVYTLHPDATLYCYHLLKQMLINGIPELTADPFNLSNIRISGADMAPDPSFAPATPFLRRVTLSYSYQYTQAWPQSRVGRVTSVEGISVDASGDPGADVGGVPTLVTAKGS